MTESELRAHVRALLDDAPYRGNKAKFCRAHGITRHATLSAFLAGDKPAASLLQAVGARRIVEVRYELKG